MANDSASRVAVGCAGSDGVGPEGGGLEGGGTDMAPIVIGATVLRQ